MWDAAVGQHYWKGYEWNSAIPEQDPFFKGNRTHYPKDNTDPRWYRELPDGFTRDDYNDMEAKRSCKDCPNVNELYWYVKKGDFYWENSLWVCMDHLYHGGHWIKKLSVIAAEEGKSVSDLKNASPDGIDYRKKRLPTPVKCRVASGHSERKPANINDYFYLPDLGFYSPGGGVDYWSSTPVYLFDIVPQPIFERSAYRLFGFGTEINLTTSSATIGCSQRWPADR